MNVLHPGGPAPPRDENPSAPSGADRLARTASPRSMEHRGESRASRKARERARRPATRRWRIPPPLLYDPDEPFEGYHLLREVEGDAALLLWLTVRDVLIWATTPRHRRGRLFDEDASTLRLALAVNAGLDEVGAPLDVLLGMLGRPERADAELVAGSCLHLAAWLAERGARDSALDYAQAAAAASPADAQVALETGRFAIAAGEALRGGTWLRRAIGLARRVGDRETYAAAYVALGRLTEAGSDLAAARRHYTRAYRAARRGRHRRQRRAACQGLMRVATASEEYAVAERYARLATRSMDPFDPGLPALLLDLGRLWLLSGRYDRAFQALQRLLDVQEEPAQRMVTLALAARAAAGLGDSLAFRESCRGAWWLIHEHAHEPQVAETLMELVRAAVQAGSLVHADRALGTLRRSAGAGTPGVDLEGAERMVAALRKQVHERAWEVE